MRNHLSLMLVAMAMFGCAPQVFDTLSDIPGHIDLSTGINSSVIEGSKQGAIERKYCYVDEPAKTFELVTDSGDVSIIVVCFSYGSDYGRSYSYAVVDFDAQADHTYRISRASIQPNVFMGIDVVDITDNRRLVTRKPLEWERASAIANASQAFVFGIFDSAGAGDTRCLIHRTRHRKYFDPGEVNFAVRCTEWSSSFGPLKSKIIAAYEADIAFNAKSSHSYAVSIQDKNGMCVQIMDVTMNPSRALFCQPAVAANEHLGKTREDLREERARTAAAARAEMEEAVAPDRLKAAQRMLNSLGYECGTPTGVVDGRTRTAVLDYQFDQGLEITGWINDSLVRHLETRVADL